MIHIAFFLYFIAVVLGFLTFFMTRTEGRRAGDRGILAYSRVLFWLWMIAVGEIFDLYEVLIAGPGELVLIYYLGVFILYGVTVQGFLNAVPALLTTIREDPFPRLTKTLHILLSVILWIGLVVGGLFESSVLFLVPEIVLYGMLIMTIIRFRSMIIKKDSDAPYGTLFLRVTLIFLPAFILETFMPYLIPGLSRFLQPATPVFLFFFLVWSVMNLRLILRRDTRQSPRSLDSWGLTEREQEIVKLLLDGKSNKEIGFELSISEKTVKNHLYKIYPKAKVQSRVELIRSVLSR